MDLVRPLPLRVSYSITLDGRLPGTRGNGAAQQNVNLDCCAFIVTSACFRIVRFVE